MFQQHHYIFLHLLNQIRPANRLIGSKFPSFRDILRQKMTELDAGWTAQKNRLVDRQWMFFWINSME